MCKVSPLTVYFKLTVLLLKYTCVSVAVSQKIPNISWHKPSDFQWRFYLHWFYSIKTPVWLLWLLWPTLYDKLLAYLSRGLKDSIPPVIELGPKITRLRFWMSDDSELSSPSASASAHGPPLRAGTFKYWRETKRLKERVHHHCLQNSNSSFCVCFALCFGGLR